MSQRFSDPELAAEYWRQNGDADLCSEGYRYGAYGREFESEEIENARLQALHRFATLPHANNPEPYSMYATDESGKILYGFDPPTEAQFEAALAHQNSERRTATSARMRHDLQSDLVRINKKLCHNDDTTPADEPRR